MCTWGNFIKLLEYWKGKTLVCCEMILWTDTLQFHFYCQLEKNKSHQGRMHLRYRSEKILLLTSLWDSIMVYDLCGMTQFTVGSANAIHVALLHAEKASWDHCDLLKEHISLPEPPFTYSLHVKAPVYSTSPSYPQRTTLSPTLAMEPRLPPSSTTST